VHIKWLNGKTEYVSPAELSRRDPVSFQIIQMLERELLNQDPDTVLNWLRQILINGENDDDILFVRGPREVCTYFYE
jgi:hypothetical protein